MCVQELTKESPCGLGFSMRMEETSHGFAIRARALGCDVLVCEERAGPEARRRWANTYNDLSDLQRIGETMVLRGRCPRKVASMFQRMAATDRIPATNYVG